MLYAKYYKFALIKLFNKFKRGFPFFNGEQHAMKATEVNGNVITFCGHTNDRCDYQIVADSYDYFYF